MPKKRKAPTLQELLDRPFCYYCERDFDDEKILIDHMKAKHLKCDNCPRRLNTAGGLSVHMKQVHKVELSKVNNANEGREGITPEVFGMVGMPEDILAVRHEQIKAEFFRTEMERRVATGNPPPGANGNPAKKLKKTETPEEIRARLAEFRAKRAARDNGPAQSASPAPQAEEPNENVAMEQHSQFQVPHSQPNSVSPAPYDTGIPPQSGYTTFNNPQTVPPYPTMPPSMQPTYQPAPVSMSPVYQNTPPSISPASYVPYNPPSNAQPLPAGLPQRPMFELPGLSRQQMSQMHPVQTAPQAQPQMAQYTQSFNAPGYGPQNGYPHGPPNPAAHSASPNGHAGHFQHRGQGQIANNNFEPQDLDSMIKSERQQSEVQSNVHASNHAAPPPHPGQNASSNGLKPSESTVSSGLIQTVGGAAATTPHTEDKPVPQSTSKDVPQTQGRHSTGSKPPKKQSVLVYNDQQMSPEERRAKFWKYTAQ